MRGMVGLGAKLKVGAAMALAWLLVGSAGASAALPPNHDEPMVSGHTGVFTLIDDGEPYAGVNCRYAAGSLVGMHIRRPIAFQNGAAQPVAWQYLIQGTDDADPYSATWQTKVTGPVERMLARNQQPAAFKPVDRSLSSVTKTWYRVVVKVFWYRPSSHVDGKALLAIDVYDDGVDTGLWSAGCPSSYTPSPVRAATSPSGLPPNPDERYVWGTYNVNALIDETDDWAFSGADCWYASGTLDRIAVRRPIAFPKGNVEQMGWRYSIEGTDDADPFVATWHAVALGPLQKVTARSPQPAPFRSLTWHAPGSLTWASYRAVVRMYWYKPSDTVAGKVFLAVESYDDGNHHASAHSFETACPATHP